MGQTDVCRHAEMKMNVSHRKNAWIGGSIVVVVVLVGLLITFVGSWWHSATSPVELFLDAPKGTEIHLHWQEGESPLRLVIKPSMVGIVYGQPSCHPGRLTSWRWSLPRSRRRFCSGN